VLKLNLRANAAASFFTCSYRSVALFLYLYYLYLRVCIGYLFGVRWIRLYLELDWSFCTVVHMLSREALMLLFNDILPPVFMSLCRC
jgi:hypothetical protein